MSEKRSPVKYHYLKVGVESNVLFTIITGIIITGALFLVLKYLILRCMFTKIWINISHIYTVNNVGIR